MANKGKYVTRVIRHETPSGARFQYVCQWGHKHETRVECAACSRQPWTGTQPTRLSVPA